MQVITNKNTGRRSLRQVGLLTFLTFSAVLSGCGGWQSNESSTGSIVVGRTLRTFTDESRTEQYGPTAGTPRKLGVFVWYPTESNRKQKGPMIPLDIAEQLSAASGIPVSVLNALPTDSEIDAPVKSGAEKFPVVVFAHGNGTTALESSSIAEMLASKGFIVVGVNHTGNAQFSIVDGNLLPGDPAGSIDSVIPTPTETSPYSVWNEYLANVEKHSETFVQDLVFTLDELERVNETDPVLKNRLDLAKIGVFGFSYGASHSFSVAQKDSRVDAVIGVDGTLWGSSAQDGISKPYMILTGPRLTDEQVNEQVQDFKARGFSEQEAKRVSEIGLSDVIAQKKSANSIRVDIPKAEHFNFTDFGVWKEYGYPIEDGLSLQVNARSVRKTVNKYMAAFFEEKLQGKSRSILQKSHQDSLVKVTVNRP